ncbi:hypothetical protein SAMN05518871_101496 [Psychrobacillus sp. OK028]|uniref:hypothetical protein n=1 Tax=Psychrobacillus sp. OK028 TaxID=1884359 RepID=UPI000887E052|nr:hypothetical protein [Psychrobacillus sp. OK028]SDM54569.1 hypothetical protein SAMN05518871_101496 [Psychrobacillus sp. OK028]
MKSTTLSTIQTQHASGISSLKQAPIKEGQVVHGKIKKLYPNQTAEVQIGNQKVIAKLETPLKAGDSHFFQVEKMAPELQLKVVTGPLAEGKSLAQQGQQLLQAMNLPKTIEMQAAIQYFIKQQLPVSKDTMMQVEQLLKQLPKDITMKAALEAIQKIVEMKLPLTSTMLQTVISGKSTDGLHSVLQNFQSQLQQDQTVVPTLKNNILQNLQKIAEPFNGPVAGAILGKQIEVLQDGQQPLATRLPILQTLKSVNVLPTTASLTNPIPITSQSAMLNSAGDLLLKFTQADPLEKGQMLEQLRSWINQQPSLTANQKSEILTLLKKDNQPNQLQVLKDALTKVFAEQSQQAIFSKDLNGLTPKDHLVSLLGKGSTMESVAQTLQQLTNIGSNSTSNNAIIQAEQQVIQQLDGKAFEHAMKEVLKSLGFGYEAKLASNSDEIRQLASQLKPQIVELLQNQSISSAVRESAEAVLGRMNGLQILSSENGPQHQLLMQVPLEFLGKKMDASLEWNGRMKEDGKIDSDFARIMFYLQLDTLKETVVDMQVQNRVVSITLYNNDTQLESLSEKFKETLKIGLSSVGYQLSGIFVKTFEEQKLASTLNAKAYTFDVQGVDIRI